MDSMQSDIFTIVMVILIVVILYWIYLDQSDKAELRSGALRNNATVVGTYIKHEYHERTHEKKSSGVAVIASFFIPGLGQIYNGQILKGIFFILLHGLSILIGILLIFAGIFNTNGTPILIGIILYPIFWVYNLYDAYNTAERTHL